MGVSMWQIFKILRFALAKRAIRAYFTAITCIDGLPR